MPTARVNGNQVYYERQGNGLPIAFVHGGYGGATSTVLPRDEVWVGAFTEAYSVLTYDRRNAGRSQYTYAPYSLDDLARDLRELLLSQGIVQSVVIGSSAGGPIAIAYALNYPEAVTALVLPNTSARLWVHPERERPAEGVRRRLAVLTSQGPEAAYALMEKERQTDSGVNISPRGRGPVPPGMAEELAQRERRTQELVAALPREKRMQYDLGELVNQSAYLGVDLMPRLQELKLPTLVVHGDADTQVPYHLGQELARLVPGASLVTINGAGHGVMQWHEAIQAIRLFCDQATSAMRGAVAEV
ncbi:MAG: alpha/beta hydrolase [Chloroflexi bacterium]|nr:alpha/beta hydrolase [Chloroflexota bacterium]